MTNAMNTKSRTGLDSRIMLLAFALIVILRLPNVFLKGRFFGEEGSYFFAYAWHMKWWEALFHPLGGYLNIVASGGTLLAKSLVSGGIMPLEGAPWVTALIALAFQMLPAVVIVTSRDAWLAPPLAKPAALLLIAAAPVAHEVWLHTLHSQFHLTICVALIVALEIPQSKALRALRLFILALAPLCGPAAIVILPFLALRTLVERTRARVIECTALGVGAAIQLLVFYFPVAVRGHSFDPAMLSTLLLIRQAVLPIAGPFAATDAGFVIFRNSGNGHVMLATLAACVLVFGSLLAIGLRHWRQPSIWLSVPALVIASISYYGAIATPQSMLLPLVGERYSFVPNVLFGLSLIALATTLRGRLARFFTGIVAVQVIIAVVFISGPTALMADGPAWPDEVAKWRADPNYRLKVWPGDGWTVNLAPGSPRCPKVAGPADPEYCEGHWEEMERRWIASMPQ